MIQPIISAMTYRVAHVLDGLPIMYQQTGKWPLIWRLDKKRESVAIGCALDALHHGSHARIQSLAQAAGHHICLELHCRMDAKYIDVRRSLPASAYQIIPDDIRVDTEGGWRQGDPNWRHALLLVNLSGLSVLSSDSREGKSPMVDWCAEHGVISSRSTYLLEIIP